MLKFCLFCLVIFSAYELNAIDLNKYEKKIKNFRSIQRIVTKYNKIDVAKTLRTFVTVSLPSRLPGTEEHKKASQFIMDFLNSLDKYSRIHIIILTRYTTFFKLKRFKLRI